MGTMEIKAEKMATQLKLWAAKLDEIVTKAEEASSRLEADYHKRLDDLKAKHGLVQAKFDAFRASGNEKWESFKADIETAWNDVKVAFRDLKH